jgi:hypothetical protein
VFVYGEKVKRRAKAKLDDLAHRRLEQLDCDALPRESAALNDVARINLHGRIGHVEHGSILPLMSLLKNALARSVRAPSAPVE